jgi:hypothetical protein
MNLNKTISKQFEGEMAVRLAEWGEDNKGAIVLTLKTVADDIIKVRYTEEDYLAYACEAIATKLGIDRDIPPTLEQILEQAKDSQQFLSIFATVVDGYQRVQFLRA